MSETGKALGTLIIGIVFLVLAILREDVGIPKEWAWVMGIIGGGLTFLMTVYLGIRVYKRWETRKYQ